MRYANGFAGVEGNKAGAWANPGVYLPLTNFDKMSITRRWELSGDGEVNMSYLILTCKSGSEFEILGSMYNGEIVALKRKIEESMHGLLGPGGTTP